MRKLPTAACLALAALLSALPATAAEFAVKDLSGTQLCTPDSLWQALQPYAPPTAAPCHTQPIGTMEVVVTPEAGELPVECRDYATAGRLCNYTADVYLAARYQGQWYARTMPFGWTPVDDLSQLPVTPPTGSRSDSELTFQFFLSFLDPATGQVTALPEGTEVFVGIAPAGSRSFTPGMVTKIYPAPSP